MAKIHPSILAADFTSLREEITRAEKAGADAFHLDIMDGHFVRNLSMGPAMVAAVNRLTDLPLDVHLMIYNPYDYIESFIAAGADSITFHLEATEDVAETIDFIRRCGRRVGLAVSPETDVTLTFKYLNQCDMLLVMTVHPGFGGQAFMPEMLEKVRLARDYSEIEIQVDGGIDAESAKECREAGANIFVAGTYLFGHSDFEERFQALKG